MLEGKPGGVQERPVQMGHRPQIARDAAVNATVRRVADHGVADRAQVDADLVRPASMNGHMRERKGPAEMRGSKDSRHGLPASTRLRRHLLPIDRITPDWGVYPPSRHDLPPDQRDVFLLDLAIVKLPRQSIVGGVVLRDDHQPGCPSIETMHDAGPFLPPDAAQIIDLVQERVDQGPAPMAGGRVDDHAGWLVDDHDVTVLIEDGELERLGGQLGNLRIGHLDGNGLPRFDRLVGLGRATGDGHESGLDEPLDLGSGVVGKDGGQKAVETGSVVVRPDRERLCCQAAFRARLGAGTKVFARYASMTMERGTSSREMNCEVENMPTLPRSSPR